MCGIVYKRTILAKQNIGDGSWMDLFNIEIINFARINVVVGFVDVSRETFYKSYFNLYKFNVPPIVMLRKKLELDILL